MPQQENTMIDLLNWTGLIIGSATFFLIGIFHVVVIKAEYYFGKNIWPAFASVGTAALTCSVLLGNAIFSSIVAVFGITCLWSIKELFEQEKRVQKGWFPKNSRRN